MNQTESLVDFLINKLNFKSMKKSILFTLTFVLVFMFSFYAVSASELRDNVMRLTVGQESGYIPEFKNINIKFSGIIPSVCKMAPCPKVIEIIISKEDVLNKKANIFILIEGGSVEIYGVNIKLLNVENNNASFLLSIISNQTTGKKPSIIGSVGTTIVTPINGQCPSQYIVSSSGLECLKVGLTLPTPISPSVGYKPAITSESLIEIIPTNGKCEYPYVINEDGTKCVKPAMPTIVIAPLVGVKEAVFNVSSGDTTLKIKEVKTDVVVAPKEGFKALITVESSTGGQDISVESNPSEKNIIISARGITAITKEVVRIGNEKLFINDKEIKIMPDTASKKAIETLEFKKDITIELKDTGKPVYEISGKKEVKIFSLFKTNMNIKTKINTETGSIEKVEKPWWSFLTW